MDMERSSVLNCLSHTLDGGVNSLRRQQHNNNNNNNYNNTASPTTSSTSLKNMEESSPEAERSKLMPEMRPQKFPAKNERDVLLRKVRSVLNKISSVNYHRLRKRWLNLMPTNLEQITEVLQLMVAKALNDPQYMNIYARLMGYLVSRRAPNSGTKIRTILNAQIHQGLKNLTTDKEIAKFSHSMEQEWIARRKKVTLHRFIAELYVENACSSKFLMERIADIITSYNDPENADEALECLCVVMTFAGQKLEETRKEWMDELFNKLNLKGSEKLAISKRIQFMVLDLLEMRSKSWAPHNKWWTPSVQIQSENVSESFSSANTLAAMNAKSSTKTAENMYLDSTAMVTAGIATASRQRTKKGSPFRSAAAAAASEKTRTLQGILNRITASTLTQMAQYVPHVLPKDPKLLDSCVDLILRKTISEPSYVQIYVKLIFHACDQSSELEKKVRAGVMRLVEADLKSLEVMRLLAELFNADIVGLEDVQRTVDMLLLTVGEPCLESLCNVILLGGKKLDAELKDLDSGSNYLDTVLYKMMDRARTGVTMRLKCFVLDLMDLRANDWVFIRPLNYVNPKIVDPTKKPYDIASIIRIIAKNGKNNISVVRASLCSRGIAEKFVFEGLNWAVQDGGEEASRLITSCLKVVMKERSLADVRPRLQLILGKVIQHIALTKGNNSDAWISFGRIMDGFYSQ